MLKHVDESLCVMFALRMLQFNLNRAVLFISAEKPNFHMGETLNK